MDLLIDRVNYTKGDRIKCRICFVFGHPSDSDVNAGNILNGHTGSLLQEILAVAQVDLKDCYFTSVIKERVTGKATKWIKFGKKNIETTNAYIQAEAALKEELSLCSANVYVPLDDIALYALTRETQISKYRGSILSSTLLDGKKVVGTLHPSSCWRNYIFRHFMVHDLIRVRKESLDPAINLPKTNLIVEPSYQQSLDYILSCNSEELIGYDIETARGQLDCFSLAKSTTDAICIPIIKDGQPYFNLEQEATILQALARLLKNGKVKKVLQNGIYDNTFMFERYGMVINNMEDTMIAHGVLLPDFPKSLAFLCSIYTRHPYYKDDGKQRFKGFLTDDYKFWRYSAQDSLATLEVWLRLKTDVVRMGLWPVYRAHVDIIEPLMQMQWYGQKMDTAAMREDIETGKQRIALLRGELNQLCGGIINSASPKQLCAYFYRHKDIQKYYKNGIPEWPNSKGLQPYLDKGRPTTDVTAMRRLRRRGIPEAEVILKIRGIQKFSSTYLEVKLDEKDYLRCSYNPVGANTGRLSSAKSIFDHGCNRQNLPHALDKYTLCDEDYLYPSLDLSGAENRIVAYYGPVPAMIEAFEKGIDVHKLTASLLYGIPIEQVSSEKGSAGIANSTKSQRDMGKMFNHSGNYDVSYKTLALKTDTPEAAIQPLLNRYHQIYPEVRLLFQSQIINQLRTNSRMVTNLFGRTRKFMDRWGPDLFRDAFAFPAQSSIADIINRWGLIYIYNNPELREVQITNQVHDSLKFKIPLRLGWQNIAHILNTIITNLEQPLTWNGRTFVIPCDLEISRLNYANKAKIPTEKNDTKLAISLQRSWEALGWPDEKRKLTRFKG